MLVSKGVYRFVIFIFIYTLIVIFAGGVVRTTQSGMGCPDWPTCFGKWIPPLHASELPADYEKYLKKQDIDHTFNVYHTWIEAINRYIAALLGLFAIIQVIILWRKKDKAKKAFNSAILYLALVIIIGLVGAVVVKLNLAHLSISLHLILAMLLLLVQLYIIKVVQNKPAILVTKRDTQFFYGLLIIIIVQFTMGTIVRMHIDTISKALLYEQREKWLIDMPIVFLLHRSFSWLVLLALLLVTYTYRNTSFLKKQTILLMGIGLANMILGIVLFYANMPAIAQPIHLLLATFAIAQICYIIFNIKYSVA
jgi:heme a synthase